MWHHQQTLKIQTPHILSRDFRQNLYNLLVMLQGSSLSLSSAVIWQSLLLLFQKAIKSFDSKSMAEFCVHRHILQVGLSSSAKHKHMAISSQLQSAKFARMSYRPKQHSLLSLTFQSFIGFWGKYGIGTKQHVLDQILRWVCCAEHRSLTGCWTTCQWKGRLLSFQLISTATSDASSQKSGINLNQSLACFWIDHNQGLQWKS